MILVSGNAYICDRWWCLFLRALKSNYPSQKPEPILITDRLLLLKAPGRQSCYYRMMKYTIALLILAVLPMQAIAKQSIAEQGRAFLEQNQHKEGVLVTKSGLQYKILAQGNNKNPTSRSRVTINYQGKHVDNSVFDSTFNSEPLILKLRKAIKGWKEGLPLIGEGGRIILFVPSRLAYGRKGLPPTIKRNETLIFIIDLIEVED